jgi:SAM-dependent methyltransferase
MNKLVPGRTQVYFCANCGHLQTNELPDLKEYYAIEYEINLSSEEDDQIYDVVDGKPVFRADHQAAVLSRKVDFFPGCRVLDYGCAKAPTLRKLSQQHPEIKPLLFDVTDKYVSFWERFPVKPEWAAHEPDPAWSGTVDVILSFYALEHVADLEEALGNVRRLLKPGGLFYFIVPNVYENTADFIVADHINHFSPMSLQIMLSNGGFSEIDVDAQAHTSAFVVNARLNGNKPPLADQAPKSELNTYLHAVQSMADYWRHIRNGIQDFESHIGAGDVAAIYGAGFYGNFVASALQGFERISCFVDQNPHLQGSKVRGKSVVSPSDMPKDVTHVLVGLNPKTAPKSIAAIDSWRGRTISFFYL